MSLLNELIKWDYLLTYIDQQQGTSMLNNHIQARKDKDKTQQTNLNHDDNTMLSIWPNEYNHFVLRKRSMCLVTSNGPHRYYNACHHGPYNVRDVELETTIIEEFNSSLPVQNDVISQTTILNAFSWMKRFVFIIQIPLKFVPGDPFADKSALFQLIA